MEMSRELLIKRVMENVSAQMIAQNHDVMAAPNPRSPGLGIVVEGVLDVCSIGDMILGEVMVWGAEKEEQAYQRGAADMVRHLRSRDQGTASQEVIAAQPAPSPAPPSPASILDGVFATVAAECDSEGGEHD